MKHEIITIMVVLLCELSILPSSARAKYGGGSGEPNDPYLIYTAEQMNEIGLNVDDWDKHFKLMADIDLSAFAGTSFNVIANFTGVFDGNSHTISNLTYTSTGTNYIGLFGFVTGDIKDLGLIAPNVDAGIESLAVGSLVGELRNGTVIGCYSTGASVSGGTAVGGLVGQSWWGTIKNCYAIGHVSGKNLVGGLVGLNHPNPITNCCSFGSVSSRSYVGGLVGINFSGLITNCYSSASVDGDDHVGGLVGNNYMDGIITNCYSTGSVVGSEKVGGLVGYDSGLVTNSFWDIQTSGQATSAGGIGLPTAEMQMSITFLSWSCESVWTIDEGKDYPRLFWENMPGDLLTKLSEFLSGSGTRADPYLIYTSEQLNLIGLFPCEWEKHFKLMGDVDLSGLTEGFNPIGTKFFPFGGIFDGCGHTISGFSVSGVFHVGLFGYVKGTTAEIRGLGLIQPEAYGKGEVGSLVGLFDSGSIKDCYAVDVKISGDFYIGGLVGLSGGRISNCYASGSVSGTSYRIGGLAGHNGSSGIIENCYANGSVISMIGSWGTGGLIGDNDGVISNCYAMGSVQGGVEVGGLVGENGYQSSSGAKIAGYISNSYSAGEVSGASYVGGFVGHHEFGSVNDCFWDVETSGQTISDGGTGLPTDQMQMASTFIDAGWDFVNVWWILEGVGYPRPLWEVPVLHAEPEITVGTSNTISWDIVLGAMEYCAECAEDANFTSIVYSTGWIIETSCEFTGLQLGQRYWYSVKARNAAGIESLWSNVESSLQCSLSDAVYLMLDPNNLKSKNLKRPYINKINIAQEMIDEGLYEDALNKLQNDILQKTDGCAETGRPDKNDWIITCEQQAVIYPLIIETIDHVKGLIQ